MDTALTALTALTMESMQPLFIYTFIHHEGRYKEKK